jgi:hypothetical protein
LKNEKVAKNGRNVNKAILPAETQNKTEQKTTKEKEERTLLFRTLELWQLIHQAEILV